MSLDGSLALQVTVDQSHSHWGWHLAFIESWEVEGITREDNEAHPKVAKQIFRLEIEKGCATNVKYHMCDICGVTQG